MAQKKPPKTQNDPQFDSSRKFEIYSLITEKISQLGDLRKILDEVLAILKTITGCRHLAILYSSRHPLKNHSLFLDN